MKVIELNLYPFDSKEVLDKILFNLVDSMNAAVENSIYYDLHDKYQRQKQLFKTDNKRIDKLNEAYEKAKNIKSKLSKKERLYQKLLRLELVEELLSGGSYKINNFEWTIAVTEADSHEKREILSYALESYDNFKTALEAKVITIYSKFKVHEDIYLDANGFNYIMQYKLENNMIDYYKNDIEEKHYSNDELTDMILNYKASLEDEDPFMDEYDYDEDVDIEAYNYFINQYFNELRSIAFRLYSVYTYFIDNNMDINELDDKSYSILHRAIHYYNLEDEIESMKEDDDYMTEYDSLPIFYKMYIHSLGMILYSSVCEEDELDELNREKREENNSELKLVERVIDNSNSCKLDFDKLTKGLILSLKKKQK